MRAIAACLIMLTTGLAPAFAGEIYGTIKKDGRPVQADTGVVICVNAKSFDGKTDAKGFYSINVTEKGEGELTVTYDNQRVTHPVYSSSTAVRYDFALVKKDGKYILRRE
jgi:hypothetical protein